MEEMICKMERLLEKASEIYQKSETKKEEKRKKGELFNTFNVIGLWSEEVRLHSAFISELLNSNGYHGCGAKFLEAFCKMTKTDFACKNANLYPEKVFDNGRIDILIEQADGKKAILIENKIYARDQPSQLSRYKEYCQKKYGSGNWKMFYLTLEGDDPQEYSTGKIEESGAYWQNISYRNDMASWLECCKKIAKEKNRVSASIEQYIDLIKQITNNDLEEEMKNEMIELLEKGNNLIAAEEMASKIEEAKLELLKTQIFPALKEKCGVTDFDFVENFGENQSSFFFKNKKWGNLYIDFWFDACKCRKFCSGICSEGKTTASIRKFIKEQLCGSEKQNKWWLVYDYMSDYLDWDTQTFCTIVHDIDKFCAAINERIARYSKIIQDALSKQ